MRRALLTLVFIAALGPGRGARADEPSADPAVAEALFRDGRTLMEAGRFAEACPKLADSERIDPHLGTLLNLAACHELQGRTATAWAEYAEGRSQAARAGRADREAFAREHALALEPKLSRVVIAAEHPAGGLEVSLDGEALGAGALGMPLPVDPGHHELRATAPGRAAWSSSFETPRGPATQTLSVPELSPLGTSPAPASLGASAAPARAQEPATHLAAADAPPESRRPGALAWGLGGLALVGIGVGSYFGLQAFAKNSDANNACSNDRCDARGMQLDSQAHTAATIANVAFGLGIAAAAGAVLALVLGGHDDAPRVAITPSGVAVGGRW
jgi:hypothetical protein